MQHHIRHAEVSQSAKNMSDTANAGNGCNAMMRLDDEIILENKIKI